MLRVVSSGQKVVNATQNFSGQKEISGVQVRGLVATMSICPPGPDIFTNLESIYILKERVGWKQPG